MRNLLIYLITIFGFTTPVWAQTVDIPEQEIELANQLIISGDMNLKELREQLQLDLGDMALINRESSVLHNFPIPFYINSPKAKSVKGKKYLPSDFAGWVTLSPTLEEEGDELSFDLEVRMQRERLNKRQSLLVIPQLVGENEEKVFTFNGVLINGKIKQKHYKRKLSYRTTAITSDLEEMKLQVLAYTDSIIKFNVRIPYDFWMDDATLRFHLVLTSSAEKEQLFSLMNGTQVKLQPREPYQPQPLYTYIRPEKLDKNRQMRGQAYLDFQVGRSVLLPTYRRNPEELVKIDALVMNILEDTDITLHAMKLCGYASPEGSWKTNEKLSKDRAISLKNYIRDKFYIPESYFTVSNVPEDWEGLRQLVDQSNMSSRERVLEIIDNVGVFDSPGRESVLMALDGGRSWRSMLTEMFPDLRRVEYEAEFTIRQYTLEEAEEIIKRKPENLSLFEIHLLVSTFDQITDPKRGELFDIMIRQNPDEPVAIINYAGELLRRGDINGARWFLDKVKDNPLAYNNEGIYHLMTGDLDEAENYFIMALANGEKEAEHNMGELTHKRENNRIMERYKYKK